MVSRDKKRHRKNNMNALSVSYYGDFETVAYPLVEMQTEKKEDVVYQPDK